MFLWAPLLVAAVIQSAPVTGVAGQGAVTLATITSTASGQVTTTAGPITGQATVTLDAVQSASTGLVGAAPVLGQSGVTLGDVQSTAAGALGPAPVTGQAAATLGPVTSTAVGAVVSLPAIVGTTSVTLGAVVSVARGGEFAPLAPVSAYTIDARPRIYTIKAKTTRRAHPVIYRDHFSAKDPGESIVLTFDFSALADSVTTPAVTAERYSGAADSTPGAIISGSAQVDGSKVLQRVAGGVAGCTYVVTAEARTADGSILREAGLLPVELAR